MDSPLYRHIPGRAQVPGGLRTTNLFGNDDHYRGVARLWHEWSRLAVPRAPSPSELHARYQDLHRGFDAWCMLVIVRACSQLRLDPAEDEDWESGIRPGNAIRLDRGVRIEWEPSGAIAFADTDADEGRTLLRFVPLIHGLEGARTRDAAEARVAPLVEAVADRPCWTVILHLALPGKPPRDALASAGNPPVPGTPGAIDFIRVSPFSLDSVERVSRAIRWATLVPRMLAYPPAVQAVPESTLRAVPELQAALESSTGNGPWRIERGGSGGWAVVRPPPERLPPVVARCLKDARAHRDRLKQEWQEVQDGLKRTRGERRSMAELNRKKRRMLEPMREAESRVEWLETFEGEIHEARRAFAALAACPACGTSDTDFEAREHDCFAARCRSDSCAAQWELRRAPETVSLASGAGRAAEARVPVFLPGDANPDEWPDDAALQWVDDVLGCDVLAIPVALDGCVIEFLPPRSAARSP